MQEETDNGSDRGMDSRETYEEKITALTEPAIEAEGIELVLVECLMMKSRWIVRLYIDKPGGVTIDDCSVISQFVGDILDVHDLLPVAYTLEVSSPGLDRPLARDRDFLNYRGHRVSVKTRIKIDGIRNFHGVLIDYNTESGEKVLLIDMGGKTWLIPRTAVQSARLEDDFKV